MQLESMYQEIILDHYKNPHGRGLREPFEAEVHHVNPTCGDEVTLRVHLDGETIADVSYEGMGCSISQASVSAMYDLVIGKSVTEALGTGEHFMTLMQSKGDAAVGVPVVVQDDVLVHRLQLHQFVPPSVTSGATPKKRWASRTPSTSASTSS